MFYQIIIITWSKNKVATGVIDAIEKSIIMSGLMCWQELVNNYY